MKTFCVYIPREELTEATAIIETTYKIVKGSIFEQVLSEIHHTTKEPFSLEIISVGQAIYFCFAASISTAEKFQAALYAIMPDVEISEISDFTEELDALSKVICVDINLKRSEIFPFRIYREFDSDSLAPVVHALSRLPPDVAMMIQIVSKPVKDTLSLQLVLFLKRMLNKFQHIFRMKYWFKKGYGKLFSEKIEEKCKMMLFRSNVRIAAIDFADGSNEKAIARIPRTENTQKLEESLDVVFSGMSTANSVDLNGITRGPVRSGIEAFRGFQRRELQGGYLLSIKEVSTLWHVPSLGTAPSAAKVSCKKGNPPKNLPSRAQNPETCLFAHTNYRSSNLPFGFQRDDRRRHLYVVGKSGCGKSKLLQLLIKNEIENGFGAAVLDPHGDLVDDVIKLIPEHRIKDVIIFDPSDFEHPPTFNPLVDVPKAQRGRVALGLVEAFKKAFGAGGSPRSEQLLRYCALTLLNTPAATILSIPRMLKDPEYLAFCTTSLDDPVVERFWREEYPSLRENFHAEAIAPILTAIDKFISHSVIRNIVGQPFNLFRLREIMDSQKILLVKISKGTLGDENTSLLGTLFISSIYQAALSRAELPIEARKDFYLYVDELDTFATSGFDEILSESRKYKLNLTLANQFLGQLPESVRRSIFGNVGNILSFAVGAEDASILEHEFRPRFKEIDIMNLSAREFYVKMTINGESHEPFSGRTLDAFAPSDHFAEACIQQSRANYSLPLEDVRHAMRELNEAA